MVLRLMNQLYSWFSVNRRSGTSSILRQIAEEHKVWVLFPTMEDAKKSGIKGAVSFEQLDALMYGLEAKPILVDNYTMIELSKMAAQEIDKLRHNIKARDEAFKAIENAINMAKTISNHVEY